MTTATFRTTPFSCPSCVKKIETGVKRLDGVEDVKVFFNSNRVKVSFDDQVADEGTIAKRISDLGYPLTSKHPAPAA